MKIVKTSKGYGIGGVPWRSLILCKDCGKMWVAASGYTRCPQCASENLEIARRKY